MVRWIYISTFTTLIHVGAQSSLRFTALPSTAADSNPTARNNRRSIPGLVMQLFFELVACLMQLVAFVRWIYISTFTILLSVGA